MIDWPWCNRFKLLKNTEESYGNNHMIIARFYQTTNTSIDLQLKHIGTESQEMLKDETIPAFSYDFTIMTILSTIWPRFHYTK